MREKRPGYWEISAPGPADPVTGKRRRIYATPVRGGRRDADRALAALQARIAGGEIVADAGTFAQALEEWWSTMTAHRWEDATSLRHRHDLDGYLLPQLGRRRLPDLQPTDLSRLYAGMVERGSAPRSIQHVHNTARAALNFAMRNGKVSRNVAEAAVVPVRKRTSRPLPAQAELEAVLAAAEPEPMWHCWFRLAFYTGARPAELCALRRNDLLLDAGLVRFDEAFGRSSEAGVGWRTKGTKTQTERSTGERLVSIDRTTIAVLRRWVGLLDERLAGARVAPTPGLFVFPGDIIGRTAITPATPSRRWRRYASEVGVDPGVRLYDASRHHHISWALTTKVATVAEIAARCGNSPETIYRTYAHLLPGNDRSIADAIDAVSAAGS